MPARPRHPFAIAIIAVAAAFLLLATPVFAQSRAASGNSYGRSTSPEANARSVPPPTGVRLLFEESDVLYPEYCPYNPYKIRTCRVVWDTPPEGVTVYVETSSDLPPLRLHWSRFPDHSSGFPYSGPSEALLFEYPQELSDEKDYTPFRRVRVRAERQGQLSDPVPAGITRPPPVLGGFSAGMFHAGWPHEGGRYDWNPRSASWLTQIPEPEGEVAVDQKPISFKGMTYVWPLYECDISFIAGAERIAQHDFTVADMGKQMTVSAHLNLSTTFDSGEFFGSLPMIFASAEVAGGWTEVECYEKSPAEEHRGLDTYIWWCNYKAIVFSPLASFRLYRPPSASEIEGRLILMRPNTDNDQNRPPGPDSEPPADCDDALASLATDDELLKVQLMGPTTIRSGMMRLVVPSGYRVFSGSAEVVTPADMEVDLADPRGPLAPLARGGKTIWIEALPGAVSGTFALQQLCSSGSVRMQEDVTLFPVELMVDGNRDGEMSFDTANVHHQDATTEARPFRFWINDDNDGTGEGSEILEPPADFIDRVIASKRDLEDFTRLWATFKGITGLLNAPGVTVHLEWKTNRGDTNWQEADGSPIIQLYKAAETDGGTRYLTEDASATSQTSDANKTAIGYVTRYLPMTFPGTYFADLTENAPHKYFLFEGAGTGGKGQLILAIKRYGEVIGTYPPLFLDIRPVGTMYERAKARSNPTDIPNPQDSTTTPAAPSVDYVPDPCAHQWEYPAASWTEAKDYVVFVHGWNTPYDRARIFFAETMFKRLWQRGYRGRFAALYWPTLVGPTTFNESEYRAWFFGESLKQYVNSLPSGYSKNLAAHSMGNVLGGSALRKGLSLRNYAMIDAAVPASCYDASAALEQPFGSYSPDHDTDPATQALAYRNKLASVNANITNFYLASDDALDLWRLNQELFRPQIFYNIGENYHGYRYYDWNATGQKLFLKFIISSTRHLSQMEESLGYAAKSSTYAVGAEGCTAGSVSSGVNLGGPGYEDEHSTFWTFNLQKMKTRYDTLMDKLGVQRNQ